MKVKTDFVTNSSSTAYIVFIPNQYYPHKSEILGAYNTISDNISETPLCVQDELDKLVDEVEMMFEELKETNEGIYPYDGYGDVTWEAWSTCLHICENHDFVLEYVDIPSDNGNVIKGIPEERIWKVLSNSIDLTGILKDFIKKEKP